MLNLIKNELIKIFKRRNIYVLLIIAIILITVYSVFIKFGNSNVDMKSQYERVYKNDTLLLENYETLSVQESYEDIIERIALEKYAIENNIEYNILLNSQNKNVQLSLDARYLLMKVFDNFDIAIICIVVYISSTIVCEEFNTGTVKQLLIKPYKRRAILLSKIITSTMIILIVTIFMILLQTVLGGLLFGFDSYSLDAIRYNKVTTNIETMNLVKYMIVLILSKVLMYLLLMLVSLLFGIITSNMSLNVLVSLGLYIISTFENLIGSVSKYIFIFNWDITNYLFAGSIVYPIVVSISSLIIIFICLNVLFINKDIVNE